MSEANTRKKKKRSLFDAAVFSGIGASRRAVKTVISKSFGALAEKFVYTSTRSYGVMSLSYGLLSLFVYLGKYYILTEPNLPLHHLIIAIVFSVIGLPLLIFDKPLCQALQDFTITDYIFFDFFSVKRMDKSDGIKGISVFSAILLGFIPALIGVFFKPLYVVGAIGLIIFTSISFVTPEFTIIFTVLVAPYLSPIPDNGITIAVLNLLAFISYLTKLIVGKRIYSFEIYDACFLLFGLIILISGIVNGHGFNSFIMLSLTLGYLLTSNIIANRRLADCIANALIVSSVPITFSAILEYTISLFGNHSFGGKLIFASADSYGAYLLITAIFAVSFAIESKTKLKKAAYLALAALDFVNIILLWHIGLWLTSSLCILAYFIIASRKGRKEWLILLIALPYLLALIPEKATQYLSEKLSLSPTIGEIFSSWKEGLSVLQENWLLGIGASPSSASNTFLSISISFGIFALIILVAVFLIRLVHHSAFKPYMKNSLLSPIANAGLLSIFSLFSLGMSADIFSDITIYYLFTSLFGIVSASLRISKNEFDERVGYYGTVRSDDASDVSIRISV